MAISSYGETKDVTYWFGDSHHADAPATWYLMVLEGNPGKAGDQSTELAGGGYARHAIANTNAKWTRTDKAITAAAENFPDPTDDQGIGAYWALADAAVAGNIIFYSAMNNPLPVGPGSPAEFPAGSIVVDPT